MRSLKSLNEQFISRSNKSVLDVPIRSVSKKILVIPTNRWRHEKEAGYLIKLFEFQNNEHRNRFLFSVIENEKHYAHPAKVTFDDMRVIVKLKTKHIDVVTELDKEFAKFCDSIYRDIVYSVEHGSEHFGQLFDES